MACEVNSGDELVATEVIFAGILTELTPEEAVAVLSAFVFQVSQTQACAAFCSARWCVTADSLQCSACTHCGSPKVFYLFMLPSIACSIDVQHEHDAHRNFQGSGSFLIFESLDG